MANYLCRVVTYALALLITSAMADEFKQSKASVLSEPLPLAPDWIPAPSEDQVKAMQFKVDVEEARAKYFDCQDHAGPCANLTNSLEYATLAENVAKAKAKRAAQLEINENNRIAELPSRLRAIASRAKAAETQLLAAHELAVNSQKERIAIENNIQQKIVDAERNAEQARIVDRVKAAEEARIAQAAAKAAEAIRCQMMREQLAKEQMSLMAEIAPAAVDSTVKAANDQVAESARNIVANVKDSADNAVKAIDVAHSALLKAEALRLNAEKAEMAAMEAKKAAQEKRARAKTALLAVNRLANSQQACEHCHH